MENEKAISATERGYKEIEKTARIAALEAETKELGRERDTYKAYSERLNSEMEALRCATDTARMMTNLRHNLDVQTKRAESAEAENERLRGELDARERHVSDKVSRAIHNAVIARAESAESALAAERAARISAELRLADYGRGCRCDGCARSGQAECPRRQGEIAELEAADGREP